MFAQLGLPLFLLHYYYYYYYVFLLPFDRWWPVELELTPALLWHRLGPCIWLAAGTAVHSVCWSTMTMFLLPRQNARAANLYNAKHQVTICSVAKEGRETGELAMPMAALTELWRSFHRIHNVVDRGVLQAMWEELAGQVVHHDQLIIC